MQRLFPFRADVPRFGVAYGASLALVGIVTAVIWLLHWNTQLTNSALAYLITVISIAVLLGVGPGVVASTAAGLIFDLFYTPPIGVISIDDPADVLTCLLFLGSALSLGQLAALQRQRTREAQARERETSVLLDVVRLMEHDELSWALLAVAAYLRQKFGLADAQVHLVTIGQPATAVADGPAAMAATDRPGDCQGQATDDITRRAATGSWRRLDLTGRAGIVGSLHIARPAGAGSAKTGDDSLLDRVAARLGEEIERRQLQQQAAETTLLRQSDRLKTAILHGVSHTLRTPLASIIASAASLHDGAEGWTDSERAELAHIIEEEAMRLNRVVGNLLDLSRVESGTLRIKREWHDFAALVADAIGNIGDPALRRHIAVDIPDDLPPVPLDFAAIEQVLINLVENALRFSPEGGEVRVAAGIHEHELIVAITDRGSGIAPQILPHIFDPFYRGSRAATEAAGLGLGLAVAKGMVEAHGGRIWAENEPSGGACFRFALPYGPVSLLGSSPWPPAA